MKFILVTLLLAFASLLNAQTETFDIASFTPPPGWKKENRGSFMSYTITNNKTRQWCQLAIYQSMAGSDNIEQDFNNEYAELVVKPNNVTAEPQTTPVEDVDGWKIKSGSVAFTFNNAPASAMIVTMSGYGRRLSIVAQMSGPDYVSTIQDFLGTIKLQVPVNMPLTTKPQTNKLPPSPDDYRPFHGYGPIESSFKYGRTTFDDGWVATEQEECVEVVKGNVKVLLYYATDRIDLSSMDYKTIANNAWNYLIPPRYTDITDFYMYTGNLSYNAAYFMSAQVKDNISGRPLFVTLFRKGIGNWIEIVSTDRPTFVNEFRIDRPVDSSPDWSPLERLSGYNRFAVDETDFRGQWIHYFSGMTQYVNAYTGLNAGATSHGSVETFNFNGNKYKWSITVAQGAVGAAQVTSADSKGTVTTPSNWEAHFSNLEGKPKTWPASFRCIGNGLRVLTMNGKDYVKPL